MRYLDSVLRVEKFLNQIFYDFWSVLTIFLLKLWSLFQVNKTTFVDMLIFLQYADILTCNELSLLDYSNPELTSNVGRNIV